MPNTSQFLLLSLPTALLLQACGGDSPSAGACSVFSQGEQIGGATVTAVRFVPSAGTVPAYCQVSANVPPQTAFILQMPLNWQKRYLHLGGGGFDGKILDYSGDYLQGGPTALSRGFAVVTSNGGHWGNPNAALGGASNDATWALNNPTLLTDYGYAAIGKVDTAAKAMVSAFYNGPPQYSYFNGCSTGGKEALQAAALYPQNYDGVIAGAPETNNSGKTSARNAVYQQFLTSANLLTAGKIATLEKATLAACDALDGVNDGIISNPTACHFDPATLLCANGDANTCLTVAQVQSVRLIRSDTTLADGTIIHSGWGLGGESQPADGITWVDAFTGNPNVSGTPSFSAIDMTARLRYFDFNNPFYDPATFQLNRDYPIIFDTDNSYGINIDPAKLTTYAASGKKMIIWNGASDFAISVNNTIRFYNQVSNAVGGPSQASAFSRLYALPGVHHCGGGTGADTFDMLGAITNWVERGQAPQNLVASKYAANGTTVQLSRPLCAYPQFSRFNGSGDPNQAANFTCVSQ